MKKIFKILGFIMLAAVIWFSVTACDELGGAVRANLTGAVSFSSSSPKVGENIIAIYNPGNGTGLPTWQWSRLTNLGEITLSSTGNTYIPVADDVGFLLRATVSYADQNSSVSATTINVVVTGDNTDPSDSECECETEDCTCDSDPGTEPECECEIGNCICDFDPGTDPECECGIEDCICDSDPGTEPECECEIGNCICDSDPDSLIVPGSNGKTAAELNLNKTFNAGAGKPGLRIFPIAQTSVNPNEITTQPTLGLWEDNKFHIEGFNNTFNGGFQNVGFFDVALLYYDQPFDEEFKISAKIKIKQTGDRSTGKGIHFGAYSNMGREPVNAKGDIIPQFGSYQQTKGLGLFFRDGSSPQFRLYYSDYYSTAAGWDPIGNPPLSNLNITNEYIYEVARVRINPDLPYSVDNAQYTYKLFDSNTGISVFDSVSADRSLPLNSTQHPYGREETIWMHESLTGSVYAGICISGSAAVISDIKIWAPANKGGNGMNWNYETDTGDNPVFKTPDTSTNISNAAVVSVSVSPVNPVSFKQPINGMFYPINATLSAFVNPSNANQSYQWVSSNPSVVTVNASGVVTPVGAGSAYVYAESIGLDSDGNTVKSNNVAITIEATPIPTSKMVVINQNSSPEAGTTANNADLTIANADSKNWFTISNAEFPTAFGGSGGWSAMQGVTVVYFDKPLLYSEGAKISAVVKMTSNLPGGIDPFNSGVIIGLMSKPDLYRTPFVHYVGNRVSQNLSRRMPITRGVPNSFSYDFSAVDFSPVALNVELGESFIYEVYREPNNNVYNIVIKDMDGTLIVSGTRSAADGVIGELDVDQPVYAGFIVSGVTVQISDIKITEGSQTLFSTPAPIND